MPRRGSGYGPEYQRARKVLLAGRPRCQLGYEGCTAVADTLDHQPPLSAFPKGLWRGRLVPACKSCNYRSGGWRLVNARRGVVRPLRKLPPPRPSASATDQLLAERLREVGSDSHLPQAPRIW